MLREELNLWVVDPTLMSKTIEGSERRFYDVHQLPLKCPPDCTPYRGLLSWHARLSLQRRPATVVTDDYISRHDNSPGRNNTDVNPFDAVVEAMVEAGDEASARVRSRAYPSASDSSRSARPT
jgi:hypothetical protein